MASRHYYEITKQSDIFNHKTYVYYVVYATLDYDGIIHRIEEKMFKTKRAAQNWCDRENKRLAPYNLDMDVQYADWTKERGDNDE